MPRGALSDGILPPWSLALETQEQVKIYVQGKVVYLSTTPMRAEAGSVTGPTRLLHPSAQ